MKNKYIKLTHISERKFREILKLFSLDLPATKVAKITNLNVRTIQRIYTLLRKRILKITLEEAREFDGSIEVDESYFGAKRIRGKRGRGANGKVPVLGLHKRSEQVFASIVQNCSKQELMPILKGQILEGSEIYTDGWKAYDGLVANGYKHHRVYHSANEFARGKNHINGIESFWSYAKFRMTKLRGVRPDKFFMHLKECEYRFNHRNENLYLLLLKNLRVE